MSLKEKWQVEMGDLIEEAVGWMIWKWMHTTHSPGHHGCPAHGEAGLVLALTTP